MDLQEEYIQRRQILSPYVRHAEKGSLFLRPKTKNSWNMLYVTFSYHPDSNHPGFYQFSAQANPTIAVNADYSHFSLNCTKAVTDTPRVEWDDFERYVLEWASSYRIEFEALRPMDAMFSLWEMFLKTYDPWLANNAPYRVMDNCYQTLVLEEEAKKLEAVSNVEGWLRERNDRIAAAWRQVRSMTDPKQYSDWFVRVVNDK